MITASGVCSNCNTFSLIKTNNQLYCQICNIYKTQDQLVPQLKFVHQNYRSNAEKHLSYKQLRVISLFQNLIDSYKVCGSSDVRLLNEEFLSYKAQKKKCQSYESITAAIFFYSYRESLYKRMKDFAEENGIDIQQFHRCFNEYSEKKQRQRQQNSIQEQFEEQTIGSILCKCEDFFKLVRAQIFAGTNVKSNLFQTITKVIMKRIQFYLETEKEIHPIICLVYRALKEYQCKISLAKYADICKKYGKATSPATISKYLKTAKKNEMEKEKEKEKETEKSTSIDLEIVL